jgi:tRNA(adenine34) deaminase
VVFFFGVMSSSATALDISYMEIALAEAREAAAKGEVPVGAIVTCGGEVVGKGHNQREIQRSPLAHAEILAIQEAASTLGRWRLSDCDLYVSLEPCVMCVGAILQARIRRLVFGCLDPKAGAVESLFALCDDARLNHRLPVAGGLLARQSADLLESFFKALRESKKISSAERWPSPAEGA